MPTTHRPTQTYTNNPQTNRHYANNLHKHIPTTHRHTETMPTTHRPTETYTNNPQTNINYANNLQTYRNIPTTHRQTETMPTTHRPTQTYTNNPQTYRNICQQATDLQKHIPTTHRQTETMPTTHRQTETMPTTHRPTETYTNNPKTYRNICQLESALESDPDWHTNTIQVDSYTHSHFTHTSASFRFKPAVQHY